MSKRIIIAPSGIFIFLQTAIIFLVLLSIFSQHYWLHRVDKLAAGYVADNLAFKSKYSNGDQEQKTIIFSRAIDRAQVGFQDILLLDKDIVQLGDTCALGSLLLVLLTLFGFRQFVKNPTNGCSAKSIKPKDAS